MRMHSFREYIGIEDGILILLFVRPALFSAFPHELESGRSRPCLTYDSAPCGCETIDSAPVFFAVSLLQSMGDQLIKLRDMPM